jgi:hypothetical protein
VEIYELPAITEAISLPVIYVLVSYMNKILGKYIEGAEDFAPFIAILFALPICIWVFPAQSIEMTVFKAIVYGLASCQLLPVARKVVDISSRM